MMDYSIPMNKDASIDYQLQEIKGSFSFDESPFALMPKGTKVLSAEPAGNSAWTTTGKITVVLPNGTLKRYFLKQIMTVSQCALGDDGKAMLRGEFSSISLIHNNLPHLVPTPLGWGKFEKSLDSTMETYYLIEDFLDMDVSIPDPSKVTAAIADLHRSIPSPNGMWGFHVATCDGKVIHTVTWTKTWREFYTNLLLGTIKNGNEKNGVWPDFERATKHLVDKVIPRLLDDLTFDGEPIKPTFLHGDLWAGNIATLRENGEIVLFDSGGFYGHNEFDISTWRCIFNRAIEHHVFSRHYMQHYEPAEPAEEWDDRNRLYSLKYILNYSINHPNENARETAYNDMLYLIEKYAPLEGLEKYNPDVGE